MNVYSIFEGWVSQIVNEIPLIKQNLDQAKKIIASDIPNPHKKYPDFKNLNWHPTLSELNDLSKDVTQSILRTCPKYTEQITTEELLKKYKNLRYPNYYEQLSYRLIQQIADQYKRDVKGEGISEASRSGLSIQKYISCIPFMEMTTLQDLLFQETCTKWNHRIEYNLLHAIQKEFKSPSERKSHRMRIDIETSKLNAYYQTIDWLFTSSSGQPSFLFLQKIQELKNCLYQIQPEYKLKLNQILQEKRYNQEHHLALIDVLLQSNDQIKKDLKSLKGEEKEEEESSVYYLNHWKTQVEERILKVYFDKPFIQLSDYMKQRLEILEGDSSSSSSSSEQLRNHIIQYKNEKIKSYVHLSSSFLKKFQQELLKYCQDHKEDKTEIGQFIERLGSLLEEEQEECQDMRDDEEIGEGAEEKNNEDEFYQLLLSSDLKNYERYLIGVLQSKISSSSSGLRISFLQSNQEQEVRELLQSKHIQPQNFRHLLRCLKEHEYIQTQIQNNESNEITQSHLIQLQSYEKNLKQLKEIINRKIKKQNELIETYKQCIRKPTTSTSSLDRKEYIPFEWLSYLDNKIKKSIMKRIKSETFLHPQEPLPKTIPFHYIEQLFIQFNAYSLIESCYPKEKEQREEEEEDSYDHLY